LFLSVTAGSGRVPSGSSPDLGAGAPWAGIRSVKVDPVPG
jgi:hypothetical protein